MAISDLKGIIDATIKTNGRQEITGASLNEVLTQMVDATDAELAKLSTETETIRTELDSQNELIEDLQNTKIDKEADDYYPQLAVGLADNLSGVDVVDSEINFRRSGGGAISDGVARIEAIKGNSVVWNQHSNIKKHVTYDNTSATSAVFKELGLLSYYTTAINGHKIFSVASDSKGKLRSIYFNDLLQKNILGGYIFTASTTVLKNTSVIAIIDAGVSVDMDVEVFFYDLTQMFGAGNEPTTIEEFYARIPMGVDLNAYNEGEVIHMDVQSIESQGVNAWDEEWEVGKININDGSNINTKTEIRSKNYSKVLPSTEYYIKTPNTIWIALLEYDADKNFLRNKGGLYGKITTSPDCHYLRFYTSEAYGTTYNHDICINISDTSINGKYFPYIKRVEDLSIIRKYFPQGMKSAGSAHDEIRYNKATQKWEYSKEKIKTLRLADLVWYYASTSKYFYTDDIDNLKSIGNNKINILCDVIVSSGWSNFVVNYGGNKATMIAVYTNATTGKCRVNILNAAYTDVSAFIAWLEEANATLYYESNDWEWVELDAEDQFKDLDYQVWNCGTEKAIAEGKSAPLAADITYGFNAIGKIKELESLVAALRAKVGI